MLTYAQPDDLADWTDTVPDNAHTLINLASLRVRRATCNDVYEVDPSGKPTEPDVIDALRDATCLQAVAWHQSGLDPSAGPAGQEAVPTSSSIAGASVTYDADRITAAERDGLDRLAPMAHDALRDAGLASSRPGMV